MKQNKKRYYMLGIALLFLTAITSTTYAFLLGSDRAENIIKVSGQNIEITEIFTPDYNLTGGKNVDKQVCFLNTGETDVLLRISFKEYLMLFQVDPDDGELVLSALGTGETAVVRSDAGTWAEGKKAAARKVNSLGNFEEIVRDGQKMYFTAASVYGEGLAWQNDQRDDTMRSHMDINWADNISLAPPAGTTDTKWIYDAEEQYFYYYKVLTPGEQTEPVMESIIVRTPVINTSKGAEYQIAVHADAIDPLTAAMETQWSLTSDSAIYQYLKKLTGD